MLILTIMVGLMTGAIYALISMGIALIFGVMRVPNIMHSELIMLGGYGVLFFVSQFSLGVTLAIMLACVMVFGIGYLTDVFVLRTVRARAKGDVEVECLVTTVGLSILFANAVFLLVGPDQRRVPSLGEGTFKILSMNIASQRLLAGIVAICVVFLVFLFLNKTKIGLAIRSVSQLPELSQVFGIRKDRIFALTFGIAGGLAALAGALIGPIQYIYPYMGAGYLTKGFVITVMGGLGSVEGALLSSLLLGVIESIVSVYISPHFATAVFFLSMVIVLLIKPSGIFGQSEN
jgi:branched-chain amino acid transport system permease protein